MIGTTRSRVSFFMNRFRKLGYIEYNGKLEIHAGAGRIASLSKISFRPVALTDAQTVATVIEDEARAAIAIMPMNFTLLFP
jgi:hypothetical protein